MDVLRGVATRLAVKLGVLAAAMCVGAWAVTLMQGRVVATEPGRPSVQGQAVVAGEVERLALAHDCWQGEGPDVIPGWAIVMRPGGDPERVPAEVGFKIWAGDSPGRLFAFCE